VERVPKAFEVHAPTSLNGTYSDKHGVRTGGWVLLAVSALAGTVLVVAGDSKHDERLQVAGGLAGAAGMLIGLVMGLQMDSAKLVPANPNDF
jgi:hypothetical protein